MKPLFRFLTAGVIGLLADAALTHVLIEHAGLGPFIARIPAIATAMAVAWFVGHSRTFGHSLAAGGFRYWAVGITAALVNYAIYATLMYRAPFLQPAVAVVFASLAAIGYSLFGYSRFVFRR
ncbi:GtrA family protein [Neorhizobium sp. CSC1952]|uniref:GtrA family protein n=1 Tax=Neorhizobium sp. CSC1952 TaxID=2978974 RepID=UPI0025A57193|nr:GtrA family protein [Rhizobium sp. CSC1952]WJR68428.1 GtrA family protein [Rhizobium sp. CSC1952]